MASGLVIVWRHGAQRLGQADDPCTRGAPASGLTSFRRREGRRDGSWTWAAGDGQLPSIGRRGLVVETARRVRDYTGGTLVMPMTVLLEPYAEAARTHEWGAKA